MYIGQELYIINPGNKHDIEMIVVRAIDKESALFEITTETDAFNWEKGYLISNKFPTTTK